MRRSRQSNLPGSAARERAANSLAADSRRGAFTLIELIFVLALLAISAAMIASNMSGFFRGRALNYEARRMLSLTHYGQSLAVSEGVPIVLWINPKDSTYGVTVQSTFNDPDPGTHPVTYTAEASLSLETPLPDATDTSEQDDEKLGLPEGVAAIRFNPDGFIDESSVHKVTIRQGTEAALDLVATDNHIGYEIRAAAAVN
jgi:prepilin-type N-terminal cleavage/methylation domain-containing protein